MNLYQQHGDITLMSAFSRLGIIALNKSAIRPAQSAGPWSLLSALFMPARCSNDNNAVPADEEVAKRMPTRRRTRQTSR